MTDFAVLRQRMVDNQIRTGGVTDHRVIGAFLTVPREVFVEPADQPFAYADRELRMSAAASDRRMMGPVVLARLVQALPLAPEANAMVVGCGSGYSAAIVSHLAGSVFAVEEDGALATLAWQCLKDSAAQNFDVVQAKLVEGHPAGAPYDAILIDGAAEIAPPALIGQLKPGGMLAAIVRDERISRASLYERVGDTATKWPLFEAWAALLPGFERKREFVF